jgi:hypothetical protein
LKTNRQFGKSGYNIISVETNKVVGSVIEFYTRSMNVALVLSTDEVRQFITDLENTVGDKDHNVSNSD